METTVIRVRPVGRNGCIYTMQERYATYTQTLTLLSAGHISGEGVQAVWHFLWIYFRYPAYATIIQDTAFLVKPVDACWFHIYVPQFQSLIFLHLLSLGKEYFL